MTRAAGLRFGWRVTGLAVLAGAGFAFQASRDTAPAIPTLTTPACSSCDARHARLPSQGTDLLEVKE